MISLTFHYCIMASLQHIYWLLGICLLTDITLGDQATVDTIASTLDIKYNIVTNFRDEGLQFDAQIVLTNQGSNPIEAGNWQIWFCSIRMLQPDKDTGRTPAEGSILGSSGLVLHHFNGCLFYLTTNSDFSGLQPGGELVVDVFGSYWEVTKTDGMPNWYVTEPSASAKAITSTEGEELNFVGPFDKTEKWKRMPVDRFDPPTLNQRYQEYAPLQPEMEINATRKITPTPMEEVLQWDSQVTIDSSWVVVRTDDLATESKFLEDRFGISPGTQSSKIIKLQVGTPPLLPNMCSNFNNEAYTYEADESQETISITGGSGAGVFYGVQTLLSLAYKDDSVPTGTVRDCPRFSYRGMHVDMGRNFVEKAAMLKIIDVMGMYKLNKLYLHLTEDEGWRVEIDGLEELTEVGADQCHDLTGDECIMPQLGGKPVKGATLKAYTQDEYREIISAATERHIEVIPEIDVPGHAHAAVKAMEARYRKYNESDPTKATEYLLSDFDDTSEYLSEQLFTDNAVNPCIDSTYNFITYVTDKLLELHNLPAHQTNTLKMFNFGGDEVPPGAWMGSPACQQNPETSTMDSEALMEYFVKKVAALTGANLDLAAWEDGVLGPYNEPYDISDLKGQTDRDVYAYSWQTVWEWGNGNRTYVMANAGYKVVLSPVTHLYFDHPHEPSPEERGYYWGPRSTNAEKTFKYMPDAVYDNMDVSRMGDPLSKDQICQDFKCPELEKPENIVGMQGQLWSETVRTESQLYEMIFPRFLSLAERAWHKAGWENEPMGRTSVEAEKDWTSFAHSAGSKELKRLEDMGIKYHIRPPGANIDSQNMLQLSAEFPGLPVSYKLEGETNWSPYTVPITVNPGMTVAVKVSSHNTSGWHTEATLTNPNSGSSGLSSSVVLMGMSSLFCCLMLKR